MPQPTASRTIVLATDAWLPQVNGVVRTYQRLVDELAARDVRLDVIAPDQFRNFPAPTYPEIRLAIASASSLAQRIEAADADAVHIATEGPIGWAARRACRRMGRVFTTSYHTRFPEYLRARFPIPTGLSYAALRRFHNAGAGMLVATASLQRELRDRGFATVTPWTRGVDTEVFRPSDARIFGHGSVLLYVGRVAVEKNLEAFLALETSGRKVVVGDGPARLDLSARFPQAQFTGKLEGAELAKAYASADVFVFPSLTDTFGIVMLEAMACGTPVAAYPVTGPIDVVEEGVNGALDDDLGRAVSRALALDRSAVREAARSFSWSACAEQFIATVAAANGRDDADPHRPGASR
ncbi:MAG: glycosyltransferase family 1 protein [Pseudomonadota bacterium]